MKFIEAVKLYGKDYKKISDYFENKHSIRHLQSYGNDLKNKLEKTNYKGPGKEILLILQAKVICKRQLKFQTEANPVDPTD